MNSLRDQIDFGHARDAVMVSGYGQFHTNEPGAERPEPYVTIDWAGVQALVDSPQQVPKGEAQWLIPSTLPTRSFLSQEREGQFLLLWADFDVEPQGVHAVEAALVINVMGEAQFEVYSSRSATTDKPKARAMVPLSQPLSGADWVIAQQVLNDMLLSAGLTPDRVSERTGQLCYLPNRGALYEARSQRTGPLFDPMLAWAKEIASKRQALAAAAAALEAARAAAAERKAARAAQTNPKGRPCLIDAFNEAHTVNDILLQARYEQRGSTFRHPNSESGSYSASVKGGRVHSLSSSDPLYTGGAGCGAHDAFSAFEVLRHGGNRTAALKDAGDSWLSIGSESWNRVERREWAQSQPASGAPEQATGFETQPPEPPDDFDLSEPDRPAGAGVTLQDFYAHMPSHQYLFVPTRELWPSASVNGSVPWLTIKGKKVAPAAWLDSNKSIVQMAWHPAEPMLISDRVLQVSGWAHHEGTTVFNLYRPPDRPSGEATLAGPWIEHLARIYPDDAAHITRWLAHRVQRPGDKCNHALVLGGLQGIGKDTILEPVKAAVGPWNWSDISPSQMLGRFNGWVKAVIVRINEARDLGDVDRFSFYDASKVYIAAPPDVIRVDEKHLRETYVANVCGVVITTNHLGDGLYLPADDRRHYVAWSPRCREDFSPDYWTKLYQWFADGGAGHVCAHLAGFDLSGFDAKAPPLKTAAFWTVVAAGDAPESGELRDVIEILGKPDALTLKALIDCAHKERLQELGDELADRKARRAMPHKLERVGYVPVRNPDSDDGLFKVNGKRQAVYGKRSMTVSEQVRAARRV